MSTALTFPAGPEYDMRNEPLGPYRLTLAQLHALPVSAERRAMRRQIARFEAAMMAFDPAAHGLVRMLPDHPMAQPVLHFMPGVLMREMHLFAGLVVVGKRHAQQHFSIISCGRATVTTEAGTQVIEGPCEFMSPAGTKRVLAVHEDMIWTTVHRTDATNIEDAEAELMLAEPALELAEAV